MRDHQTNAGSAKSHLSELPNTEKETKARTDSMGMSTRLVHRLAGKQLSTRLLVSIARFGCKFFFLSGHTKEVGFVFFSFLFFVLLERGGVKNGFVL